MSFKSFVMKGGAAVAPLLLAVSMGAAQPAQAASGTVVVATSTAPANCGRYHTAVTDLAGVLNTARGGKVLICPGDYPLIDFVVIAGANGLTVSQAVKGDANRPRIIVFQGSDIGIKVQESNRVTLDGLIVDGTGIPLNGSFANYNGIRFVHSSGAVRNSIVEGTLGTFLGINVNHSGGQARPVSVTIANTQVLGYQDCGIYTQGPVRLTVTGSLVDATDQGRVPVDANHLQKGICYEGQTSDPTSPTGLISKTTIRNNIDGVTLNQVSKVTVSGNTLTDNQFGILVESGLFHASNGNRIIGNTITGIPDISVFGDPGIGISVFDDGDAQNLPELNTTISRNTIVAFHQNGSGIGIKVDSTVPVTRNVTGMVSGNTLIDFMRGNEIINLGPTGFRIGRNMMQILP